jgi:hypothetical protein
MKRKIIFLTLLIAFIGFSTTAKVWRVSNRNIDNIAVDADFNTLQDAIDGASGGDTLYLMGSKSSYGSGTFDKKLVVIGPGYWLTENQYTQAISDTARVSTLTFNEGSQGSKVQGLSLVYSYSVDWPNAVNFKYIIINTDSITIAKNYIFLYRYGNYTPGTFEGITIYGDRTNIKIQQNWIEVEINDGYSGYNGSIIAIHFTGVPSNCFIRNNFISSNKSNTYGTATNIRMDINDMTNDLKIYNNVLWGDCLTYYTDQRNNIFVSGVYNGVGDILMYNLCNETQYPVDPPELYNQQNIDMSTVFTDYAKFIDNGYVLATGSPAIGAGVNGGDCGVFSFDTGGFPYVLSGMPAIPSIYEAIVQPIVGSSLPVTIKAVSHNEHK